MTEDDRFRTKLVLEQVLGILKSDPNHCDYDYLSHLARELQYKLQETCGFCESPCGNDYCVTKGEDNE